jgi:predicted O-methyltransferase YrrM
MIFSDSAVAAVFADYQRRMADENLRLQAIGVSGMHAHRDEFLLPVGPEAGEFLHGLIIAKRPRRILELGTSYGYSTLFLADAARHTGAKLVTMDLVDYKQKYARDMIVKAGLASVVDFRLGDALALIAADTGTFDLVLLDIWKEMYVPCLHAVYPKLADEGIIVADNMIEPAMVREDVRRYRAAVHKLPDMQTTLLPIGSGMELSVKWRSDNTKL